MQKQHRRALGPTPFFWFLVCFSFPSTLGVPKRIALASKASYKLAALSLFPYRDDFFWSQFEIAGNIYIYDIKYDHIQICPGIFFGGMPCPWYQSHDDQFILVLILATAVFIFPAKIDSWKSTICGTGRWTGRPGLGLPWLTVMQETFCWLQIPTHSLVGEICVFSMFLHVFRFPSWPGRVWSQLSCRSHFCPNNLITQEC